MNIAVVGTGYVGLVVGSVSRERQRRGLRRQRPGEDPDAAAGHHAVLRAGAGGDRPPEPHEGRLEFSTLLPRSVRGADIVFVAVGTPQDEDGSADLTHVLAVARDVARAMNGYKVIVCKSTVPVGTAALVREVVRRETTHPFSVVSNPSS